MFQNYAVIVALGAAALLGFVALHNTAPAKAALVPLLAPNDVTTTCLPDGSPSQTHSQTHSQTLSQTLCQFDVSHRLPHSLEMPIGAPRVLRGPWHGQALTRDDAGSYMGRSDASAVILTPETSIS